MVIESLDVCASVSVMMTVEPLSRHANKPNEWFVVMQVSRFVLDRLVPGGSDSTHKVTSQNLQRLPIPGQINLGKGETQSPCFLAKNRKTCSHSFRDHGPWPWPLQPTRPALASVNSMHSLCQKGTRPEARYELVLRMCKHSNFSSSSAFA